MDPVYNVEVIEVWKDFTKNCVYYGAFQIRSIKITYILESVLTILNMHIDFIFDGIPQIDLSDKAILQSHLNEVWLLDPDAKKHRPDSPTIGLPLVIFNFKTQKWRFRKYIDAAVGYVEEAVSIDLKLSTYLKRSLG